MKVPSGTWPVVSNLYYWQNTLKSRSFETSIIIWLINSHCHVHIENGDIETAWTSKNEKSYFPSYPSYFLPKYGFKCFFPPVFFPVKAERILRGWRIEWIPDRDRIRRNPENILRSDYPVEIPSPRTNPFCWEIGSIQLFWSVFGTET